MDISLFDFDLPQDLIAQVPVAVRDQSRLMVVNRQTKTFSHHTFAEIGNFLLPGAVLLRNNASVLPARLRGTRPSGGAVECLLLNPGAATSDWWCLLRPGKKLPPGSRFGAEKEWSAEVLEVTEDGRRLVRFTPLRQEDFLTLVNRVGEIPLPPYIQREENDQRSTTDRERYQTVYAEPRKQVAAAAPTAGLHFTPRLQEALLKQGFSFEDLTLHIGLGTFQPIKTERVEDFQIHREIYEIPVAMQKLLARENPPPRVAVGTTVTRSVEDFFRKNPPATGDETTYIDEAGIFIYPPFRFQGIDALITNFHLPRSSLLCLVSAFLAPGETAGIPWLMELYQEAIRERYRFFSYGDAMLIL